jgi:hypothetical protein
MHHVGDQTKVKLCLFVVRFPSNLKSKIMEEWWSKLAVNRTKESHLQTTDVIKLMIRDLTVGHTEQTDANITSW